MSLERERESTPYFSTAKAHVHLYIKHVFLDILSHPVYVEQTSDLTQWRFINFNPPYDPTFQFLCLRHSLSSIINYCVFLGTQESMISLSVFITTAFAANVAGMFYHTVDGIPSASISTYQRNDHSVGTTNHSSSS